MPAVVMPQVAQPRTFPQPTLTRASMRVVKFRACREAVEEERVALQSGEHAYLIQRRLKDSIYGVVVLANRVEWSAEDACFSIAGEPSCVAVKIFCKGA